MCGLTLVLMPFVIASIGFLMGLTLVIRDCIYGYVWWDHALLTLVFALGTILGLYNIFQFHHVVCL